MWPQIILLVLLGLGQGVAMAKHGEPDTNNGFTTLIANILVILILLWGGFFDCFLSP